MEEIVNNSSASPAIPRALEMTNHEAHCKNNVFQAEVERLPLVAKLLIETITDVDLLRKFRLVSKDCNFEACRALRKWSISITTLRTEDLEDFYSVLNKGATLSLPSPFQQLSMIVKSAPENILSTLHHQLGLDDNFLGEFFLGPDDLDQIENCIQVEELGRFGICLEKSSTEVTKWVLSNNTRKYFEVFKDIDELQTLGVSKAGSVSRPRRYYVNCTTMVQSIKFEGSPLTNLKVRIESFLVLLIFRNLDLTQIQDLHLEMAPESPYMHIYCRDTLATLQWPCLKSLRLDFINNCHHEYASQVVSLLNTIAPSLECLAMNTKYWKTVVAFPKLKSITLDEMTQEDFLNFTNERFPSLEEIRIERLAISSANLVGIDWDPLDGVRKLSAKVEYTERSGTIESNKATLAWITALTEKLPNVQRLTLFTYDRSWTSLCFPSFSRAYSQLKCLELSGEDLARLKMNLNILLLRSQYFPNLETLVLQQESISNATIENFVACIPKLKNLKLCWCERLSERVFRDSLQHLEVLEILNFMDWRNILTQLRAVMPGTLIKALYSKY